MLLFPPGSLPTGPVLETKKALMLLDFQNDFVSPNGKLYAANTTKFLSKLPDLVDRFRESGEVVWTKTEFRGPCSALSFETGGFCILLKQFVKNFIEHDESSSNYAFPAEDDDNPTHAEYTEPVVESDPEAFLAADIQNDRRCCVPGTSGSEFPALLRAAMSKQDIITTKSQYSAFADMLLLHQLRTRRVTDLYICGTLSNISVYATALDAVRHGFQVTVVEDCLGYRSETCHLHAMRQMADNMCVEGIDYQELMDDLAGLLGDVVKEGTYSTKFEVDISRPTLADKRNASARSVNQWITGVEPSTFPDNDHAQYSRNDSNIRPDSSDSDNRDESFDDTQMSNQRSPTIHPSSPPRKRSTNDLDGELEVSPHVRLSHQGSIRRSSYDSYARPDSRGKKIKQRVRRTTKDFTCGSDGSTKSPSLPFSSIGFEDDKMTQSREQTPSKPVSEIGINNPSFDKRSSKKAPMVFLGPDDQIGDGTSRVVYDVLSKTHADSAFEMLKTNVKWQKMYHRSGEVPRLVAVQGDIVNSSVDNSTTYPIYRHPADESPALLPFDHTVDLLRQECEKHVGHTLNHVLIQHYRNSEDNISEHSDKTLDIVRGSSIVNLSLGAKRTMILRTKSKKSHPDSDPLSISPRSSPHPQSSSIPPPPREAQRVPLPHSSLFILSTNTNAKFLHSIRADKRRPAEKSPEELAFNGERISLTFRHVGTYITETAGGTQLIWGQGAKGKKRSEANPVLKVNSSNTSEVDDEKRILSSNTDRHGNGPNSTNDNTKPEQSNTDAESKNFDTKHTISPAQNQQQEQHTHHNKFQFQFQQEANQAELQIQKMIASFGKENHEDDSFDWDGVYGSGFDVVNFVTKKNNVDDVGIGFESVPLVGVGVGIGIGLGIGGSRNGSLS